MRFLERYIRHYLWLALAATAVAIIGWIILFVPLSRAPIPLGIKFGLAFSAPLNFLVIPPLYHLLPRGPGGATGLRLIALVFGFVSPYLCVLAWRRYDVENLIHWWRGDNIVNDLVLIPFLVFGALAGIWCAKFFVRLGDISSIFDVNAVIRSSQS